MNTKAINKVITIKQRREDEWVVYWEHDALKASAVFGGPDALDSAWAYAQNRLLPGSIVKVDKLSSDEISVFKKITLNVNPGLEFIGEADPPKPKSEKYKRYFKHRATGRFYLMRGTIDGADGVPDIYVLENGNGELFAKKALPFLITHQEVLQSDVDIFMF